MLGVGCSLGLGGVVSYQSPVNPVPLHENLGEDYRDNRGEEDREYRDNEGRAWAGMSVKPGAGGFRGALGEVSL